MEELELDWQFPVLQSRLTQDGQVGSRSALARTALPEDEVFRRLAGEDPRPLLILRECTSCTGTDDALLTRQEDNEKTLLLSRWFNCVKLPANVLEEDHPFHAVFAGDRPAHLFVSRVDGSERRDLKGDESRTELWDVMESMLDLTYLSSHEKPLKRIAKLLDELDEVDLRVVDLESRLDDAIEKHGPDSSRVEKYRKKLAEEREELAELRGELETISRLELRPAPEGEASSSF